MLDKRLAALGTDYVDLFFIHGLGDDHTLDDAIDLVKSQEFKETAEAIRKSGKAKFVGFSTHHKDRAQIIQAAAEGGIVDAIMLQYTPWLDKDSPLNKALDACHEKGIGLISMKQIAGQFLGDKPKGTSSRRSSSGCPMLAEKKLTPVPGPAARDLDRRADQRGRASRCKNTDQIRENADAARRFEPLKTAEIDQLRDAALAARPDALRRLRRPLLGRRRHQGRAGQPDPVPDLPRAPRRSAPRPAASTPRSPPEARDWSGADLEAARAACPNRLDFAKLLPEVERHLA